MFFWGLVVGLILGYLFKPQIEKLINSFKELINKNKNKDGK